jgi:TolB protein
MNAHLRIIIYASALAVAALPAAGAVGIFDNNSDIGITPKAGKTEFAAGAKEYRVTGAGANVWGKVDAFQFVWKKVTGDVTLTADVQFVGTGAVLHRKAMLMIRQSLEPDAPYADAALHGDGLTSLQYRPDAGAMTVEIQSTTKMPVRLRIERRGDKMMMYAGKPGGELQPIGPATLALKGPVYAGLGVCSHNANILETVVFSNVTLETATQQGGGNRGVSKISVYDLRTNSVEVIYTTNQHFEAPNWSPDGKYLLLNSAGSLWRLGLDQKLVAAPVKIDLGKVTGCNNDHGISPDGKLLAISAQMDKRPSQVFVSNADGSGARLMTPKSPSYYHGWSPDGRWLAFVAERGDKNFDLYRVPVKGGKEERLTSDPGHEDGADYSPDGKWIYFNSDRTGGFDIWRIPAKGAGKNDKNAQRITSDDYEDWFPHPSPDGKWLVFLSFAKGVKGHPDGQDVVLRMMPLPGAKLKPAEIKTVTKLFGGQGTINVSSWSPDSTRFAFVSYR